MIICEDQSRVLACPVGRTIKILDTNYGRRHESICGFSTNTDCHDGGVSMPIIEDACNDKRACFLEANNAAWDDTCSGTYKYLEIDYECRTFVFSCSRCWRVLCIRNPEETCLCLLFSQHARFGLTRLFVLTMYYKKWFLFLLHSSVCAVRYVIANDLVALQ